MYSKYRNEINIECRETYPILFINHAPIPPKQFLIGTSTRLDFRCFGLFCIVTLENIQTLGGKQFNTVAKATHSRTCRQQFYMINTTPYRWSKLWSSQIWSFSFLGEGYSGVNFGHLKSEVFHWGEGGFLVWNSRKGLSGEFGHTFYYLRNVYTNLLVHHR